MGKFKHIDLSYLNTTAEGSQEFITEMINAFLEQTPELLAEIETAIQSKDWANVKASTHKFKPTAVMMGISAVTSDVLTLENIGLTKTNTENAPVLFNKIKTEILAACDELKAHIA